MDATPFHRKAMRVLPTFGGATGATVAGCTFSSGGSCPNWNFQNAAFPSKTTMPTGFNVSGSNFTGAAMPSLIAKSANFNNSIFKSGSLAGGTVTGATFSGATFCNWLLTGTGGFNATGAVFYNTTMPDGTVRTDAGLTACPK